MRDTLFELQEEREGDHIQDSDSVLLYYVA